MLADGKWRWDDDALGERPRADARGTRPSAADFFEMGVESWAEIWYNMRSNVWQIVGSA